MNSFGDVASVLIVTSLGMLCLLSFIRIESRSHGGRWQTSGFLARFPVLRRSVEWRRSLSLPSDFNQLIHGLSRSAQLELAEELLQEGEFTRVLLDVVGCIALGSNSSLRWRSIGLLDVDSISPPARVHLADRILRDSSDEDLKIQGIKSLVGMLENGTAARHIALSESIAAIIAARLGDDSESVRRFAREQFQQSQILQSLMSGADPYVAQALIMSDREVKRDIQRFVHAYQVRLPRSCIWARRYDSLN